MYGFVRKILEPVHAVVLMPYPFGDSPAVRVSGFREKTRHSAPAPFRLNPYPEVETAGGMGNCSNQYADGYISDKSVHKRLEFE